MSLQRSMSKLGLAARFSAGDVVCGRLGNKSEILALGSSDKSVYLHRLSGELCGVLPHHPTGIEALAFDKEDTSVVAGCSGGSIYVWDVPSQTQLTSLPGHRANCTSVEYHPFGHFFASGSSDTNVKIWDSRQSRCVQTYRNHTCEVTTVKFSPHGRWLVSGDEEGIVKVWDLSSGKELASLESHTDGISSLDFHPTDFFLISSSLDRTTKLWNCENGFSLAASSEEDASPIRRAKFNHDGKAMIVATSSTLKSFAIDTDDKRISATTSIDIPFLNLLDIDTATSGAVTALSSDGMHISVWSEGSSSSAPDTVKKRPPKIRDRIASARRDGDEIVLEKKENTTSTNIQTPSPRGTSRVRDILEKRLLVARSICSAWTSGNSRAAVEAASVDLFVFVSLLHALPTERTKTALSIDSCAKVLSQILSFGLLTLPITPSDACVAALASLPFSSSVEAGNSSFPSHSSVDFSFVVTGALQTVTYLAKRFCPILTELRRASKLPTTPGTDFTREERIAKAIACLDIFESVTDILQQDAKTSRFLKREKEEAAREIESLIQL